MKLIFLLFLFIALNCLQLPNSFINQNETRLIGIGKIGIRCNKTKCVRKNCSWLQRLGITIIGKPVIYLYPEEPMDISVQIKLTNNEFTTIYPKFNGKNTWNVHAEPNGDIYVKGRKYPYLFWEANSYNPQDTNEGFIVSDKEAENFLEEKLSILGLNDKEKTDFITFWLPVLLKNKLSL